MLPRIRCREFLSKKYLTKQRKCWSLLPVFVRCIIDSMAKQKREHRLNNCDLSLYNIHLPRKVNILVYLIFVIHIYL